MYQLHLNMVDGQKEEDDDGLLSDIENACFFCLPFSEDENGQLPDFEQRVKDASPRSRHLEEQAWPGAGGCGACSQVKMVLQFIKI